MFSYDSLLPFGVIEHGELAIRDSFSLIDETGGADESSFIYVLSKFVGEEAPKIQIELTPNGQDAPLYISHSYSVGSKGEYSRQEWRVPTRIRSGILVSIHVEIPKNTIFYIKDFGSAPVYPVNDLNGWMRNNAHLGFWGLAPDNTTEAIRLAAQSSFYSCIVVPKVTKDGVIVCIHDDTINRTARDENGKAPEEPIYVWDKTYEELSEWEYGSWKNEIYKGARLPLLSEFFDICQETGMRPMFSTHPALPPEKWQEVKGMLQSRGLLEKFHIKSFDIEVLKTAYQIFGSEIEGFTYDVSHWEDSKIDDLKNLGIKNCRVGIEVRANEVTEEITKKITEAGFFASVWNVERRDFSEYEKWASFGISESTEDFHCSMGLNF